MLFRGNKISHFVLLFEGRTGSSYLIESLDAHPHVRAKGEYLVKLRDKGAEAQLSWAKRSLTTSFITRYRAVGFKTKLRDILNPEKFRALLIEKLILFICAEGISSRL